MDQAISFDHATVQETADDEGAAVSQAPRMPCIALMGEFSAGKTTLINFLLGEDLLPTRVTATQLPPVWMSFGERAAHYVDTEGNQHDLDLDDLHSVPVEGVQYIKLFCEADILLEMDLIDTPGISDPNIPDHHRAAIVEYVDAVIWCTHATQAWRESERSVWMTIPEALQANSILLATRSDKLNERDRLRVHQRLQREIGDRFRTIVMFSATDAIRACQMEDETELLDSSGGAALVETLQAISREIAEVSGASRIPLNTQMASSEVSEADAAGQTFVRPTRVTAVRPARVERGGRDQHINENPDDSDPPQDETGDFADNPETLSAEETALTDPEASVNASVDDEGIGDEVEATETDFSDEELEEALEAALEDDVEEASDPVEAVAEAELEQTAEEDDDDSTEDSASYRIIEMASDVDEEFEDVDDDAPDDVSMAGVLDLKKYEVAKSTPPTIDDDVEDQDDSDTNDISDFVARARDADANDQDADEDTSGEDYDDVLADDQPVSAKVIWEDILANNVIETVPDLVSAFSLFIETLDQHGLVIATPVDGVDMAGEHGDTSGMRMLG
jgi:GTPase SAR1 family protein